jgi:hypothetical protein
MVDDVGESDVPIAHLQLLLQFYVQRSIFFNHDTSIIVELLY